MTDATPTLDAYQRVFALSFLANGVMSEVAPRDVLAQRLFHKLSYYLTVPPGAEPPDRKYQAFAAPDHRAFAALGQGEVVWGPAVNATGLPWLKDATNAAFVARFADFHSPPGGPTGPVYVVAIAATNPTSLRDILIQDGFVDQVVAWEGFKPADVVHGDAPVDPQTTPYISRATAQGVSDLLLKLSPPDWAPAAGRSLMDFLAGVQEEDAALIFCGHSLAGALSPTLALYLAESPERPLAGFGARVWTYPTAGATPGNQAFADRFAKRFGPVSWDGAVETAGYRLFNARLWNHYDVVPHAWALTTHRDCDGQQSPSMTEILGLYGELDILTRLAVWADVHPAEHLSTESGIAYWTLNGVRLDEPRPATPKSYAGFWETLLKCHIYDYGHGLILPGGLPGDYPHYQFEA